MRFQALLKIHEQQQLERKEEEERMRLESIRDALIKSIRFLCFISDGSRWNAFVDQQKAALQSRLDGGELTQAGYERRLIVLQENWFESILSVWSLSEASCCS